MPFSTGFHKGDALYRDLETHLANAEHWHAAVFTGFAVDGAGNGTLSGVEATGDWTAMFWNDTVQRFAVSRSFADPGDDVAATMEQLRDAFVGKFAPTTPYHGARHAPNLTPAQRTAIAATAGSLVGKGILYTWSDMMDYKGWDWDATVGDIDETRCDGIVEYSYERNNIQVCGGTNPALWQIGTAGTAQVDNHNDFHNNSYNPGELCPRIQAGDQAADTTFVETPADPPSIVDFTALGYTFIFVPSIWFRVDAPNYAQVLARITVSKDGGPAHFLQTEDPYGATGAIVGDWRWRQVPANTGASSNVGFWLGRTVGGPNYLNRNGQFEFELVTVDGGGNVSDVRSQTVRIEWHGDRITCIRKTPRDDPRHAIAAVGGVHSDGRRWTLPLTAAIAEVEAGQTFYVEQPLGDRVGVEVATSAYGRKYLKTVADGDLPNNLLSLPECPP